MTDNPAACARPRRESVVGGADGCAVVMCDGSTRLVRRVGDFQNSAQTWLQVTLGGAATSPWSERVRGRTHAVPDYYADLAPLDMARRLHRLDTVLDDLPAARLIRLTYEDLSFASPDAQQRWLTELWAFLAVDAVPWDQARYFMRPEQVKLASKDLYTRIPNSADIERALGSDEAGWLLKG